MSENQEGRQGSAPGGGPSRGVKVAGITVLALVVVYLLFTQVFPRVEGYLEDPTLGGAVHLLG